MFDNIDVKMSVHNVDVLDFRYEKSLYEMFQYNTNIYVTFGFLNKVHTGIQFPLM